LRHRFQGDPITARGDGGVISELDIWRAANLLIRKHGADAEP
jgi:hypothetical protein